jgi:hypothetical protein
LTEHDLVRKPVSTFRDHALPPLLGLKLGLERRKLGERRIRIGFTLALAPIASVAALDVLGPQLGIAIRAVATLALRTVAALVTTLIAIRPIRSLGPRLRPLLRPRWTIGANGPLARPLTRPICRTIGAIRTTTTATVRAPALAGRLARAAFDGRNGWRALGRSRRFAAALLPLVRAAWPTLAIGTSARAPHLHEIRLHGLGLGGGRIDRSGCRFHGRRFRRGGLGHRFGGR